MCSDDAVKKYLWPSDQVLIHFHRFHPPSTQWGKDCSPHCFWFFFLNWGSERLSNLPPESPKLKASDWDLTQICPAPKRTFSPLHDSVIFSLQYREGSRQTGTQKESKGTRVQGGEKRSGWGRARVHYPHGSCTLEQVSQPQHTDTWGSVIPRGGRSGEQPVWCSQQHPRPLPTRCSKCDNKNVSTHCQIPPEGQLTLGEEPLPRRMASTRMIRGRARHNVGYLPYMFTLQSTIRFTPLICPPQRILQSFHILRYNGSFGHC